jgi:hypothetical protein
MSEQTIYRVTTFFKRKPGITEEQFNSRKLATQKPEQLISSDLFRLGGSPRPTGSSLGCQAWDHSIHPGSFIIREHFLQEYQVSPVKFHTPSSLRNKISSGNDMPSGSWTLEYDGGVDWYVRRYEDYEAAFKDPYYLDGIEPDEWNFVDKGAGKEIAGAVSTLGIFRHIVKDGKSMVREAELTEEQKALLGS